MAFYKRLFILLIFTTTFTAATAQKKIKEKKVTEIDGVICFKRNSKPVTGIVYSKYESGIEKYHYYVKDGKKNGIEIHFRENGVSKIQRNYKDGLLDGLTVNWLKDGGIEQQYYKDGKKDSLFTKWDKDEKLIETRNYKEGLLNGLTVNWLKDGGIEQQYYKDGKKDSLFTKWDKDKKIVETRNYKDDKLDGLSVKILDDQTKNSVIEWVKEESIYSHIDFENLYESKYGHLQRWKSLRNWIYRTNDRIYIIEQIEENYKNGLLDGSSTIWFLNAGQVQQTYINGLANGQYARFGKNGKSIETGYYKDGQKNGEFILMDTLGKVLSRRVFSNDMPNFVLEEEVEFDDDICYYILPNKEKRVFSGFLRSFWCDGCGVKSEKRISNGKIDGIQKYYHNNRNERGNKYLHGTISEIYFVKDGKKEGLYESWQFGVFEFAPDRDTFKMDKKCYYKNDKYDSIYLEWNNDNVLVKKYFYKNGEYDGLCEEWHDNGKKAKEWFYTNGQILNGVQRQWWDNGQLYSEFKNVDGKRVGNERMWRKDGKLESENRYKNGELEGVQTYWYRNGQVKKTMEYKNGKRNGYSINWREDGTRSTSNFYINGQRQFDREINYDRDGNPKK